MIEDLIRDGWGYHDTESERLAAELERANLDELAGGGPAQCLRLSNHMIGEEPVDEAFIRLAAARSHIGLSDMKSAEQPLATADALAGAWSEKSLTTWYQGERRKVDSAMGDDK